MTIIETIDGIVLILIVAFCFLAAFRAYVKERFSWSLFFILLVGCALRVFVSLDFYLHEWDERYHALVAKNLLDFPFKPMLYTIPLLDYDVTNWTANHIWVHKQPVPLYTMAASLFVFGKHVIAFRLPSIVLSTVSILATYKIGKLLYHAKVGIIASFFFSINGLIIELTGGRVATDHIDVFFMSFISLAVYFLLYSVEKKRLSFFLLGIICTSAAILSKWLPALIVFPIWAIYAYKKIRFVDLIYRSLLFMLGVFILIMPWQVYIMEAFPVEANWEYYYNKLHILEGIGEHAHPFYYHWDRMRILFGELIYLPLLWFVYQYVKKRQWINNELILLTWVFIPYLFFSFVATKMQGYIIFCAPALFIIVASFIDQLNENRIRVSKGIKVLLIITLIGLPLSYTFERVKPFSSQPRSLEWVKYLRAIDDKNKHEKVVLFNTKYPIEAMFHSDFIAYYDLPDVQKIDSIHQLGYHILMDQHQDIPPAIDTLHYVEFIDLQKPQNQ